MKKENQREKEIKNLLPIVRIAKNWAEIKESDLSDRSKLIAKFDEGYYSVMLLDEDGKFKRLISQYQFKEDFLKSSFRCTKNLYVNYEENENALKLKLAEMFYDTKAKEVPVLYEGRISALGRLSNYFDIYGQWDSMRVYNFRWEWIDKDVAREYFCNRRSILISSEHGLLEGFREAFSSFLDIVVYKDVLLNRCLAGGFDMMVQGSDFFQGFPMEKVWVHRLYFILLVETVRRWLSRRGIAVHFFSYGEKVPEVENRVDTQNEQIGATRGFLREGNEPYFIVDGNYYDDVIGERRRKPGYHSGRRSTTKAKNVSGNGIYFFGPCVALGLGSYMPEKSIESIIQRKLNIDDLNFHVVNCGTEAIPGGGAIWFNWLYRLMDTPLRCGDIVVIFERMFDHWGIEHNWIPPNYHSLLPPFISEDNIDKKVFFEPHLEHLNPTGCEIAAEYIYKIMWKDINVNRFPDVRKAFFSIHRLPMRKVSRINEWLNQLSMYSPKQKEDVGAVVMCGDPITIGHLHLVKEAMRKCDFLYIFLTNKEDFLITLEKRIEFLREYFREDTVAVLSLGTCERQPFRWDRPPGDFLTIPPEKYDPVEDTYTFARYIAPRLGIRKRFVGEEPYDLFKQHYNILKREILEEEGIEYVEIPRIKLGDGRDIITSNVRKILQENGWEACRDYLPKDEVGFFEK